MPRSARKPRDEAPQTSPPANANARRQLIRDAFAERFRINRRIQALEEQHIAPEKENRRTKWKNLAADTGLAVTDLNHQFKIYERQELAKTFDEEADRDAVLDAQREIFEALSEGQTMDFLSVLDKVTVTVTAGAGGSGQDTNVKAPDEPDAPEEDPATSPDYTSIRALGMAAQRRGEAFHVADTAYDPKTQVRENQAWRYGFMFEAGAQARRDGKPVTSNPSTVGTANWKAWDAGWDYEAKKDGEDAASVQDASDAA